LCSGERIIDGAVGAFADGADPVLAEGTRVGDLRISGLLGEGAMGQVYLAQDVTLGRRVALKIIKRAVMQGERGDGARRFLEEARATASFNHPHIVTLYAVGEHDGRPYLALEYLDGASLRTRLAAGPLPLREALCTCRAVADAIAEAHRRGLVHADLKPENIVLPRDGRVRVVDFGLAKLARAAPDAASGTPAYMAPERWRGAPPTGAIDVWALGVILHELTTGKRPIPDAALRHFMFAPDALELVRALSGLPDAPWVWLVRDCLELDPAVRPTAAAVARRLAALTAGAPEVASGAPDEDPDQTQDQVPGQVPGQAPDRAPDRVPGRAPGQAQAQADHDTQDEALVTTKLQLATEPDPARPDAEEREAMRRIGAATVELFRRYCRVLHALHATSLPDIPALAAAVRGIVAEDPAWPHAYALLAVIEGQSTDAARDVLAAARIAASAARDLSGMHLLGALELAARGEPDAAFQAAGDVLQEDRADLLAAHLLASWALLARRNEECLAIIRPLHAAFPELTFGMYIAEVLRWEGRDGDADRVIREWAAAAPDSLPARVELVRIEANAGRLDEARARAREVARLHGPRDDALPDLFEALVASDQISEARGIADRMLAGSPLARARGRYRVAMTSLFEGRFAAAYDAVRRAIAEHRAFGMQSELTQCLELARSLAPLVGDVHAQRRYTDELAVALGAMIGDAGAAAALRFELALLERGDAEPSIDAHLAGLEDGPARDVARRRMLRVAALAGAGSMHDAVAAGFSTCEESTASLVALGLCARRVRELPLARRSFERAIRRWSSVTSNQSSPYHAVLARFHLAGVLDELGERAGARAAYEAFLRCWADPDRPIPEVAVARRKLDLATRPGVVLTTSVAAMRHPGRNTSPPPIAQLAEATLASGAAPAAAASAVAAPAVTAPIGSVPGAEAQPFEVRRETLAALVHGGCAALAARTPMLVTIRGDAGIGKTPLASALHGAMAQAVPGARVLALRGLDPSVGEVDGTIRAILRGLVSPPGVIAPRPEARARLAAQLGDVWPAVALTLGWIGRDAPELEPLAQAPGALRIATVEATARLIRRAAERAPLCILLDDAHLADATALDALELATLARTAAVPLWICVLVRPSFDSLRPSWGERAERAESLDLAPLPDAAAQELCRALLHPAENLPAELVAMITERADGNVMLLGELCRALKTEGIIRQERTGAWILETDRLEAWPRTPRLAWLASRELGRLPPELVGHAQLAALLGPKFAVPDLIGVLKALEASPVAPRFALDPAVALAQLDRAQLLRVRGRGECELRNAMLCEAMRATIPEPLRIELHRAAFEHYRDHSNLPPERRQPRLALHAAEAGLREPAAMAYEALAAEYLYRHRYVEAEGAFSRMLALVEAAPRRLAALHGRGLARYRTGRYEDALGDLHQARELADGLGDRRARLAILLDEATVLDWLQSFRRSAELVDQARALAAGADEEPVIAARLAMARARSRWRLGRSVEARAWLREAVDRAEAAGSAAYESLIASLLMLGTVLGELGEIRQAREVFDRALSMACAQGDRLHEIAALNNRRLVWIAEKDVARAAADLHALLDIGRTLGLVLVELVGTYNLGELLYQAGDVEAAWPHVERAVALAARRPDLLPRPIVRLLELRLLAYEGRWQEVRALSAAVAELQRAAQTQGRVEEQQLASEALLLDALQLASGGGGGAGGGAGPWAQAWDQVRARSERCAEDQRPIEIIEMQALGALRAGDLAVARRCLGEAIDLARRIPNVMEARLLHRLSSLDA
jgi:tetratricopeptide (TPR) repeat protein